MHAVENGQEQRKQRLSGKIVQNWSKLCHAFVLCRGADTQPPTTDGARRHGAEGYRGGNEAAQVDLRTLSPVETLMQGLTSCTASHDIPTQKCIQVEHTVQGQRGIILLSNPTTRISRRLHPLNSPPLMIPTILAVPLHNVVLSC